MALSRKLLEELEKSVQDLTNVEPVAKFMLFGPSGVGKTVLAVRMAQKITKPGREILYVDFKDGWVSLLNHDPALRERVRRIVYSGYSQLETIVDAIEAGAGSFGNVGAVVVDEHSSMAQDDLENITAARAKDDSNKDPDTPTWPDMNTSGLRARRNLLSLLALRVHVILVAHERDDKDKEGVVVTGPGYLPKTKPKILEPLHLAARCSATIVEGGDANSRYKRTVQCHPSKRVSCKSRVGGLEVFESHGSLINKVDTWLQSGGKVEEEEVKLVILQDEQSTVDPEYSDDGAIVVE